MSDFLVDLRQRIRARRKRVLGRNTGDTPGNLGLACVLFMTVREQQGLRRQHRHKGDRIPATKTYAGSEHWPDVITNCDRDERPCIRKTLYPFMDRANRPVRKSFSMTQSPRKL